MAARSSPAQAVQLLSQAGEAYRAALEREEDALTWSNLADALVQVGSVGRGCQRLLLTRRCARVS